MTSSYRATVGLPPAPGGRPERLMRVALDKLPYLAFAVAVDQWGCSIYGDRRAGARLQAFLALGASRPWAEALQTLTGSWRMDAAPLLGYFAPLEAWLDEQSRGRTCPLP